MVNVDGSDALLVAGTVAGAWWLVDSGRVAVPSDPAAVLAPGVLVNALLFGAMFLGMVYFFRKAGRQRE